MEKSEEYLVLRFIERLLARNKLDNLDKLYKISLSRFTAMVKRSSLVPDISVVADWIKATYIGTITAQHITINPLIIKEHFEEHVMSLKTLNILDAAEIKLSDDIDKEAIKQHKLNEKNKHKRVKLTAEEKRNLKSIEREKQNVMNKIDKSTLRYIRENRHIKERYKFD